MLRFSSRGHSFTGRGPMIGGSMDIAEESSETLLLASLDKCVSDTLSEPESLRSESVEGLLFLVLDGFMAA